METGKPIRMTKENRRHERIPYVGQARICWEDEQGLTSYAQAKFLDISVGGLRIEVAEAVPVRSILSMRADLINIGGSATVRHIAWRRCKYILGLNLSQTLSAKDLAIAGLSALQHSANPETASGPALRRRRLNCQN